MEELLRSTDAGPSSAKILRTVLTLAAVLAVTAGLGLLGFSFWQKQKTGQEVTLTYWGLFEPPAVFDQVIADFVKENPKLKITYQQQDLKFYRERLQAALAKGEGPDIFRFHQSWMPMFKNYLSLIPSTVYTPAGFEETFYPSAKQTLLAQGHYAGIPLMYEGLALFYNEDLFRSAGVTPPRTWDELRQAASRLTVRDTQGKIRTAGAALGETGNIDHWSDILALMLVQNGADLSNPASSLAADALAYYSLFSRTDRVWDETLPSSTYAFASGMLAMYFGPSWRIFDIKSLNPQLNFKVVSVPQLPGADIGWSTYWVEGVSKNSPSQESAWKFLQYLSTREVLEKLYQAESALRGFGEIYSRADMADLLQAHPYAGAYLTDAPKAVSGYLCSNTSDGDTGINSQMIKYYADAVNAVNKGADPISALQTTAQGVAQVLRQYGLVK